MKQMKRLNRVHKVELQKEGYDWKEYGLISEDKEKARYGNKVTGKEVIVDRVSSCRQ